MTRRLYFTLPMRIKRAQKQNERWVLRQITAAHRQKLLWREPIMLSIPMRNAVARLLLQGVITYRKRRILGGWALVKVDSRRYV